MASLALNISSSAQTLLDPNTDPSNFTITYQQPIPLDGFDYEVAIQTVDTWFTNWNVVNKTIVWSSNNGVSWNTITIPNGNYPIEDINALLQTAQTNAAVIGTTVGHIYGIQILGNFNLNRAYIQIDNTVAASAYTFLLDLTATNNLSNYLGFVPAVISTTTTGTLLPNVNAGQDNWNVRCDLVRNSYSNGIAGQILFTFVPGLVDVSEKIFIEPLHLNFMQVNKSIINSINMQLVDQNGAEVNLQGSDINYNLIVRPIGKIDR